MAVFLRALIARKRRKSHSLIALSIRRYDKITKSPSAHAIYAIHAKSNRHSGAKCLSALSYRRLAVLLHAMSWKINYMREAWLILGWLLFFYLLLSLSTYSPDDPSWSVYNDSGDVENKAGIFGAYVADILFNFCGYSAYLLAVVMLSAWHIIMHRIHSGKDDTELFKWPWQVGGILLFILASAALEYLRFNSSGGGLPAGSGGVAGKLIAVSMEKFFGEGGEFLILIGAWMISCSLIAGLSWFSLSEIIGERLGKIAVAVFEFFSQKHSARLGKEAREKREKEVKRTSYLLKVRADEAAMRTEIRLGKPSSANKTSSPPPAGKSAKQLPLSQLGDEANAPPPTSLLDPFQEEKETISEKTLEYNSRLIEKNLLDFGVSANVEDALPGPVITRYDVRPATGVKGAQIVNLMKDMARAMAVGNIRILETIDGKNCMGLEIPNPNRRTVYFSELVLSDEFNRMNVELPLALGKDASGVPVVIDLTAMPHLLVAGATGSGKSVCINAMLLSLLFAATTDKLRLILIDPKMLELSAYAGIPHLLAPVVTDMKETPAALNWCVAEMERRYRLISEIGARGITTFNKIVAKEKKMAADGTPLKPLPYIVIIIDELADLMMVAGKKVEITISRLAQKARAPPVFT